MPGKRFARITGWKFSNQFSASCKSVEYAETSNESPKFDSILDGAAQATNAAARQLKLALVKPFLGEQSTGIELVFEFQQTESVQWNPKPPAPTPKQLLQH